MADFVVDPNLGGGDSLVQDPTSAPATQSGPDIITMPPAMRAAYSISGPTAAFTSGSGSGGTGEATFDSALRALLETALRSTLR
jgi:hypothetical protein